MVRSIFDKPEISILPVCEHMTKKSVVIRPCCHFAACLLANGIRGTWYYLGEKVFQLTRLARGLRSQLHSKAELHSQVRYIGTSILKLAYIRMFGFDGKQSAIRN